MLHSKCGVLLLASLIPTNCFATLLCIINRDFFHPNQLLSSLHPLPPFQFSISPSVHVPGLEGVSPSQTAMCSAERHCDRSVTVRPPSFHAPLALMCAHAGRLCEATQTPSWWDRSCSLSYVLTPQTLCPFLSSRAINVGDIFEVASLKHRLIAMIAVECCCKLISRVKMNSNKLTTCQSLENVFFPSLIDWRWLKCISHH